MAFAFGCDHQLPTIVSPAIASISRGAAPRAEARTTPWLSMKASALATSASRAGVASRSGEAAAAIGSAESFEMGIEGDFPEMTVGVLEVAGVAAVER